MKLSELDEEQRTGLTRYIMNSLDDWGLSSDQCWAILDLPGKRSGKSLRRFRDNAPFPDEEQVNQRIDHLYGIIEALRTTFPRNENMAKQWMGRTNRKFQKSSPLKIIMENGMSGLVRVRLHLDCTFAWALTDEDTSY